MEANGYYLVAALQELKAFSCANPHFSTTKFFIVRPEGQGLPSLQSCHRRGLMASQGCGGVSDVSTPPSLNLDVGCSGVAVISFHALWHPSRVCFPLHLPFNLAQSCMKFSWLVPLSLPKSFSRWVFRLPTIQSSQISLHCRKAAVYSLLFEPTHSSD